MGGGGNAAATTLNCVGNWDSLFQLRIEQTDVMQNMQISCEPEARSKRFYLVSLLLYASASSFYPDGV